MLFGSTVMHLQVNVMLCPLEDIIIIIFYSYTRKTLQHSILETGKYIDQ